MSSAAQEASAPRRLGWSILVGMLTLSVIEAASWLFFTRVGADRLDLAAPERYTLKSTSVVARVFDPELGWLSGRRGAHGERPRPVDHGRPYLMTFGDSHTRCEEIGDGETWQVRLGGELGADVLNFGVTAYGPDQALLYYERVSRSVAAPVVALGFPLEGINRIVNTYRPFYYPRTGAPLTKPRFVLDGGRLRLVPNPIQSAGELERLRDPAFVAELGEEDFWYRGAGRPRLRFPYSRLLLDPAVWRLALAGETSDTDPIGGEALWRDAKTRSLMFAITDAFVAKAQARGSRPILLLMPLHHMIRKRRAGERIDGRLELRRHCSERSYLCFDGIDALAAEEAYGAGELYMPGGHLSPLGARVFARQLARFLRQNGLAPGEADEGDRGRSQGLRFPLLWLAQRFGFASAATGTSGCRRLSSGSARKHLRTWRSRGSFAG